MPEINTLQWVSIIGSGASIIGLIITIYVFIDVRNIKKKFIFKVRFPTLHKQLQKHASKINSLLNNYPQSKESIIEELSIVQVNVKNILRKSPNTMQTSVKELNELLKEYNFDDENKLKQHTREIYLKINMLTQEMKNYKEDDKWGGNSD